MTMQGLLGIMMNHLACVTAGMGPGQADGGVGLSRELSAWRLSPACERDQPRDWAALRRTMQLRHRGPSYKVSAAGPGSWPAA